MDENDESPRFVNEPRPFLATVQTNSPPGTSVYQLMARDDDQGSTIHYELESGKLIYITIRYIYNTENRV